MQISTIYYVPNYNYNFKKQTQNQTSPVFKAINVRKLTPEQIKKFSEVASIGSITASAILLINKSSYDNSNPKTELDKQMRDTQFIAYNKNYNEKLRRTYWQNFGEYLVDYWDDGKYSADKTLYSQDLSERLTNAALKLVDIPEFTKFFDRMAQSRNVEVTPQNLEVVEEFLNNDVLLNNENLRKKFARILSIINTPDKKYSDMFISITKDIFQKTIQGENPRTDIGEQILEDIE